MKTDVIFRKYRSGNRAIIAIFPAEPTDSMGRYCQMYEHVGQHSGGSYEIVMAQTTLARPNEYHVLKVELEAEPYRYKLQVCSRRTPQHRREYELTLKAWLTRNQDSSVTGVIA